MSDLFADSLIYGWNRNLEYGTKLLSAVAPNLITAQPVAGMNHPAWIFSHINLYLPIMCNILVGAAFPDPKEHRHGMQSSPSAAPADYAERDQLLEEFREGHKRVESALRGASAEIMARPISLERWRNSMGSNGTTLTYLMLVHENQHLGQVSAWRRAMSLPPV